MSRPVMTLVTTSFPVQGDGSEAAGAFVADLAEELSRHINVRVVAPGVEDRRESWIEGVDVYRFAAPLMPLSTLRPYKPRDALTTLRVLRRGMQATRLAATGSHHILALWALPSGAWAKRAARELGINYSVWMLGSDIWSLGRIPLVRHILKQVIQHAQYAYADGYQLAADARRIAGGRDVEFLPSTRRIGISPPPPPRSQPPYRLLFLGRWHPNKGVDLLLQALASLEDADWLKIETVEVQGGGPMQEQVAAAVKRLQAQGRPVVLGRFLAKNEAEDAMARADWLLIPSRIESIPVVFSDAMKMGRPVVAMPVGDLPKLLRDKECGILSASVQSSDYARAVKRALRVSTAGFWAGIGAQAAAFDVAGTTEKIVDRMVKLRF